MIAANSKAGAKPKLAEGLVVHTYFKGVSSGQQIFDKVDKDSDEGWSLEFKSPMHGKMVYRIKLDYRTLSPTGVRFGSQQDHASKRSFWQV
jgi:hypothetical protein